MGELKLWNGSAWLTAADAGRLKLWTGTEWVEEADPDWPSRPLAGYVGGVWTTFADLARHNDVVPVGVVDLFGRADGVVDDEPADCGNSWYSIGTKQHVVSGRLTVDPLAGVYAEAAIYLGGAGMAVRADVATGPASLGASAAWALDVLVGKPGEFERFRYEQAATSGLLSYIDPAGIRTTLASTVGYAYDTTFRWELAATPTSTGTHLHLTRSNPDGTGRTVMASAFASQALTGNWMSWGCRYPQALDNVYRIASPVLFADDFTRADSATTLGSPWTASSGTWGVTSGKAYCAVSGNGRAALVDAATGDYTYRADVTLTAGSDAGLWFRWVDPANCWLLAINPAASLTLFRAVGNVFTSVATAATPSSGTFEVVTSGSSIVVRQNGTQVIAVTDSAHQSATLLGLRSQNDTVSRWDNVVVTTV